MLTQNRLSNPKSETSELALPHDSLSERTILEKQVDMTAKPRCLANLEKTNEAYKTNP